VTSAKSTNAWLQTFTGKIFEPMNPQPEQVDILDIAHGLSHICRFSGQCSEFYSVAQHSAMASHVVALLDGFLLLSAEDRVGMQLIALLHDASEAFIVDVPTMIKAELPRYKEIEAGVMRAVARKFDLDIAVFDHPLIHEADAVMLATEKRDLMGPEPQPWIDLPKPYGGSIFPMEPKQAKQSFLERFKELGGRA
jgi:5'-deoxynucleotidase YfbR-like HD superfamily hydrolase